MSNQSHLKELEMGQGAFALDEHRLQRMRSNVNLMEMKLFKPFELKSFIKVPSLVRPRVVGCVLSMRECEYLQVGCDIGNKIEPSHILDSYAKVEIF